MSAGKNRQSGRTTSYCSYRCPSLPCRTYTCRIDCLLLHAAAIFAVACADVGSALHPSLGLHPFIDAAPGCPFIGRGGVETGGV
jgi:hypothetical protein